MTFKTDQEAFWAGEFGNEYIQRNQGAALLASYLDFFSKALRAAPGVKTVIEFGANIGMNLKALKLLHPTQEQHGVEINADAAHQLAQVISTEHVYQTSILDFQPVQTWDLVLIKGVLTHINPDVLPQVYEKLVAASSRYLLLAEYYTRNRSPLRTGAMRTAYLRATLQVRLWTVTRRCTSSTMALPTGATLDFRRIILPGF